MTAVTASPPRLQTQAWPTRFQKEQEAAGVDLGKLPNDRESIGPWILGDMIGKGSSGRVKLGKHKYSGKIAAMKIISKNAMLSSKTGIAYMDAKHQKALQGIHREIVIMKLINHPCIMSLYDLQETENEFYLALEYVEGGELFDYLVSRGRLPEPEALNYFKQIIFGLDYCHRFNISHRDLKPENILLDKNMNIKIADFGMAALEVANGMLETSCGSPHYASPEIVAGKAYHGASSDIWSCGVVLYALLSGRLPFDHPNIRTLLQKVKLGKFKMHESLSPKAQDLIGRMLVVDPEERITIPEIFQHPFFKGETNAIFRNPDPPTLEDLSKPIGSREYIESAYLDSLQILFHKSRADIERALRVRDEPNWEKAFLYLLRVYAERVRENYGEEDEDEVEEVVPVPRRNMHLQIERDVFADITTRLNVGGRRSVDVRPPIKLSGPPLGRKRALTVSTEPQFGLPIPSPTKLIAARAAPLPVVEGRAGRGREESHMREDSGRRSRPPNVVGPRPNPPASPTKPKARPRSVYLEPGPVSMMREQPGSGMTRTHERAGGVALEQGGVMPGYEWPIMAHEQTTSAMARETPGSGMVLRDWDMHRVDSPPPLPRKSPFEPTFQDVVMGAEPTPFRSVLSPDPDRTFGDEYVHLKRWSEDTDEGEARRREEDREVAKKSNLSPHAAEFRFGGQAKLVRKSKPTPLALANPNWHPVSSASQPGTPGLDSPRLGQPKVTGWFQNLFTFRPVFHVLYSTVPPELTRREITQMLSDFGVAVSKQEDQELLKCYVDRFHDLDGTLMTKPVRFRIEIRSTGGSPTLPGTPLRSPMLELPGTQYPCVLTITQEKGAHSTLKAVYAKLRASWRLDSLVSPVPVSAGSTMTTQTPMLE